MKEILQKVKRLEVKMRRLVNTTFAGEYRSSFKGSGLEFDEVRAYQFGDDVRFIDWNVSAKTNSLFVKIFKEQRELNLFVLVDVSGSEYFGDTHGRKINIAIELSALLGFCTLPNNDKFGLIAYSDQVEIFFKPSKGRKRILGIVDKLMQIQPQSSGTNLRIALERFRNTQKRKSVLFIISDFLDTNFEMALKAIHHKHDVVLIRLYHPDENMSDFSGILPVNDLESGATSWIYSKGGTTTSRIQERFEQVNFNLLELSRQYDLGYLNIDVTQDYLPQLEHFFSTRRNKR